MPDPKPLGPAGPLLFLVLLLAATAATVWRYQEPAPAPPGSDRFSAVAARSVLERILPTAAEAEVAKERTANENAD